MAFCTNTVLYTCYNAIIYNILYDVEEQLPNIFEHMMIIDWTWLLSSFIEGFCPMQILI